MLPAREIQKSQSFISTFCYRNVRDELQKTRHRGGNLGMVIRKNFMRQERLDTLAEFYSQNKKKYP